MNNFGQMLRRARQDAKKTLLDVAHHLEVSIPYVSDVENGRRAPFAPGKTIKVAELLGVDPTPLLATAARTRGAFELEADGSNEKKQAVGASLMRNWRDLTSEQLDGIGAILGKGKPDV